jgi:hypothetical protein
MALNDFPQIIQASINSDQSAIRLQLILNHSTGFVMRPDVPDFGCDFDVEIIREQTNVSSWRFPIQLKSVEQITIIQDGKYISYSFKTSRLGYLLRRQPASGLIILYDVATKIFYFEYADEVYLRLTEERNSDDWHANDYVNILIPLTNILNEQRAAELHQKFSWRFAQAALMQSAHGRNYGLPVVNLEPKAGYDFNNLDDVKRALKEKGMSLLLQFELQIVYSLLLQVPMVQILADKELCLVAVIAFAEAGKFVDSVYYTERIRKRFQLDEWEKHAVDFMELKNQLSLGQIGPAEYLERAKAMLPGQTGINLFVLKINILFFELSQLRVLEPMPLHLGDDVQKLFFEIEDTVTDVVQKQYLKLWNAENMMIWISHFRSEGFAEMQLRETMGKPFSMEERLEKAQLLIKVHSMFYLFLNEIDKRAKATENYLLQAHTIKLLIRFELSFEIDQISHELPVGDDREPKILHKIGLAGSAFNTFLNNNLYNDAYFTLLYQIDLIYVARNRYKLNDEFDLDKLLTIKAQMEKEFEFEGELSIPGLLSRKENQKTETGPPMSYLNGLHEAQLDTLAEMMMQSNKYPLAKKEHIISQMKSYQLFNERCTDPHISVSELLVTDAVAYATPVYFRLHNKLTNMVSLDDWDMNRLLKSWGY